MKYNPQIHHRRSIRLHKYDYSQAGAYFITICCRNKESHFGTIQNQIMTLNQMGQIAYNEWIKTSELRSHIELDTFIIMPNHIHGIIIINNNAKRNLSNNTSFDNCQSNTIGAIIRGYKSSVSKQIKMLNNIENLWQRNYYEHIIRDEQSYQTISEYIINNPIRWKDDKFFFQ